MVLLLLVFDIIVDWISFSDTNDISVYLLKLLYRGSSAWIWMGPGMQDLMVAISSSFPFMARSHGDT